MLLAQRLRFAGGSSFQPASSSKRWMRPSPPRGERPCRSRPRRSAAGRATAADLGDGGVVPCHTPGRACRRARRRCSWRRPARSRCSRGTARGPGPRSRAARTRRGRDRGRRPSRRSARAGTVAALARELGLDADPRRVRGDAEGRRDRPWPPAPRSPRSSPRPRSTDTSCPGRGRGPHARSAPLGGKAAARRSTCRR